MRALEPQIRHSGCSVLLTRSCFQVGSVQRYRNCVSWACVHTGMIYTVHTQMHALHIHTSVVYIYTIYIHISILLHLSNMFKSRNYYGHLQSNTIKCSICPSYILSSFSRSGKPGSQYLLICSILVNGIGSFRIDNLIPSRKSKPINNSSIFNFFCGKTDIL